MAAQKINVLIVEDDFSFGLDLELLVNDIGCNVLKRVDNSAEALEVIFSQNPDLILMDIDIKGALSGIEIAEKIKHLQIPILFVTSHGETEMYDQAKSYNSIGYLVKPLQMFTLRSAINLAIEQLSKPPKNSTTDSEKEHESFVKEEYLFFKKKDIYQKVHVSDILYLESDNNYVNIYTSVEKYVIRQKLSDFKNYLPDYFNTIHRSTVVNIKKIEAYNHQTFKVILVGGHALEVSRSNRDEVLSLYPRFK